MNRTLVDWLYTTEKGLGQRPGALITYPKTLNSSNILTLLCQTNQSHMVAVVSNSHQDAEINLNYTNLDDISSTISNSEVDIIIFDSIRLLSTIISDLTIKPSRCKIIVLYTWGDTESDLTHIFSHLPDLRLLNLHIIAKPYILTIDTIAVALLPVHLNSLDHQCNRPSTLYMYPHHIKHNICQASELSMSDNYLAADTWLTENMLLSLNERGPKLVSIIDSVIANYPAKQIIYTINHNRSGIDLISSILTIMADKRQSPYTNIYQVSSLSEEITETLNMYESASESLLITNITPYINLATPTIVHVIDDYQVGRVLTLLDRCRSVDKLYVHVASNTVEVDQAQKLLQSLEEIDILWNGLETQGLSLYLKDDKLYVDQAI